MTTTTTTDATALDALAGLDAARRAGWAKYYAEARRADDEARRADRLEWEREILLDQFALFVHAVLVLRGDGPAGDALHRIAARQVMWVGDRSPDPRATLRGAEATWEARGYWPLTEGRYPRDPPPLSSEAASLLDPPTTTTDPEEGHR